MDMDSLTTFVDVMRRGSFSAVAKHRNIDPSSISRLVASLENELGVRLFTRTTRRMSPTEAGHVFFNKVAPIIEQLQHAKLAAQDVMKVSAGRLRVGTSTAFAMLRLLPLLPKFRKIHPNISVDLIMTDKKLDLVAERIDLAILFGPEREIDSPATKLFATRFVVCASAGYLAEYGLPSSPAELTTRNCLLADQPADAGQWTFRRDGVEQQIPVSGDLKFSDALAIRDCALADMGPALLPDWMIEADLKEKRLIDLFPDHAITRTDFDTAAWIMFPSPNYQPARAISFLNFIMSHCWKASAIDAVEGHEEPLAAIKYIHRQLRR